MQAANDNALPISLRPSEPGDRGFILDSWIRSYRDSPWARMMGHAYTDGHDALIKRILGRSAVLVACYDADPETILGWACTERDVVHYVYVKHKLRRRGIARMLLGPFVSREVRYTHMLPAKPGNDNGWSVPQGWRFDPYPMMVAT
jgi:GNAT superfamily N-acetyltransferase